MYTIEKSVAEFRDALVTFGAKNILKLVADFEKILSKGYSPSQYWKCIGSGAFKECYELYDEDVIVKFASNANATSAEKNVLDTATENGFGYTFIPSVYIPLSVKLPVYFIEDSASYEYRYTYHKTMPVPKKDRVYLVTAIVQKKIAKTADRLECDGLYYAIHCGGYSKKPIRKQNGEAVSASVFEECRIDNISWIQTFINRFGYDTFMSLLLFLQDNYISDLHDRNIGYLRDGTPVIFDWLA